MHAIASSSHSIQHSLHTKEDVTHSIEASIRSMMGHSHPTDASPRPIVPSPCRAKALTRPNRPFPFDILSCPFRSAYPASLLIRMREPPRRQGRKDMRQGKMVNFRRNSSWRVTWRSRRLGGLSFVQPAILGPAEKKAREESFCAPNEQEVVLSPAFQTWSRTFRSARSSLSRAPARG